MRLADLEGRRVALWGLGREGRSTLRAIRRRLPELPLTVLDDDEVDGAELEVSTVIGREAVAAALPGFDVVVRSPGVSLYRPEIEAAHRRGVVFTSATRLWFAEHPAARTVCVTGTKGKSTTASLIAHCLAAGGIAAELRGNIGRPLLDPAEAEPEVWVIELSSYQTADLEADPTVAVLLNLFPEHLDWHGDADTYYRDKLRLFAHQKNGVAVVNGQDPGIKRWSDIFENVVYFNEGNGLHARGDFIHDGARRLLPVKEILLPGAHNLSNVCAALAALKTLGFDAADLAEHIASFRGLPHRLETLGERNGILYVDDSISTTPESAMAAIEAFPGRSVTVLLGGYDRGIAYEELAGFLVHREIHTVVTLPPSGRRIAAAVERARGEHTARPYLVEAADLFTAVDLAGRLTPPGGVVLLSPAAPSYGAFRDFIERGEAFARAAGFLSPSVTERSRA